MYLLDKRTSKITSDFPSSYFLTIKIRFSRARHLQIVNLFPHYANMCWEIRKQSFNFRRRERKSKFYMLINSIQFGGERVKQLGPKKERKEQNGVRWCKVWWRKPKLAPGVHCNCFCLCGFFALV